MSPSMQKSPSLLDSHPNHLELTYSYVKVLGTQDWDSFHLGAPNVCQTITSMNLPCLPCLQGDISPPTTSTHPPDSWGLCLDTGEVVIVATVKASTTIDTWDICFSHVKKNSVMFFRWRWQILKAPSQKKSRRVVAAEFLFCILVARAIPFMCVFYSKTYIQSVYYILYIYRIFLCITVNISIGNVWFLNP